MRAGHEARLLARQIGDGVRDVVGLAAARDRLRVRAHFGDHRLGRILAFVGHLERGGEDIGVDEAGADRVHADAILGKIGRRDLGQMQHARLGDGIGGRRIAGAERRDARSVDDRGAFAALHMGRGIADAHRDRFEDEVHRPVPSVGRDFVDRGAVAACGGIVEHDVDAAAALRSFVHQRFDVRRDGDVAPDEFDPAVRRRGKRLTARLVDVGGENMGAFAREFQNGRLADTRCCAGDDGDLACESHFLLSRFLLPLSLGAWEGASTARNRTLRRRNGSAAQPR